MGIFRPQKYIFMSIKLFTIFSIKCYEESHKINEWKFSCDTTTDFFVSATLRTTTSSLFFF